MALFRCGSGALDVLKNKVVTMSDTNSINNVSSSISINVVGTGTASAIIDVSNYTQAVTSKTGAGNLDANGYITGIKNDGTITSNRIFITPSGGSGTVDVTDWDYMLLAASCESAVTVNVALS